VFSYSWIVLLQSVWHIFSLLIQSSNIILIIYYRTASFLTLRLFYFVEISIDDEQWNDGLLATIREKVLILKHPVVFISSTHEIDCCPVHFGFLMSSLYFVDQVHMEAERKAMVNQTNVQADGQFQSRTTYRIRNKVILFLESTVVSFVHSSWLPKRLHFML
jgi:centromere protein O